MSQYWSPNDVTMLFHRLIHTVAVRGRGILDDESLSEVREYIKSNEHLIHYEMADAMYECRNSGKSAKQEIAIRYHNLTGCTMQESREFAEDWITKAKKSLEDVYKGGM